MDERIGRANRTYDRMVFAGDDDGFADAGAGLDAVEADLCLARGKLLHARFAETATSTRLRRVAGSRPAPPPTWSA